MLRYCVDVFMVHAKCSLLYFILVFGWVGGGMDGISPFSCVVSIDFSILINVKKTTVYTHVNGDRRSHIENSQFWGHPVVILACLCSETFVQ